VEHADEAVVACFRVHDYPSEYVQPLRLADLVVVWAPRRDAGDSTFVDRATTNAVSVAELLRWCDAQRATAGRVLRVDAADTDQGTSSTLNFDAVFRKMFQAARVY